MYVYMFIVKNGALEETSIWLPSEEKSMWGLHYISGSTTTGFGSTLGFCCASTTSSDLYSSISHMSSSIVGSNNNWTELDCICDVQWNGNHKVIMTLMAIPFPMHTQTTILWVHLEKWVRPTDCTILHHIIEKLILWLRYFPLLSLSNNACTGQQALHGDWMSEDSGK